MHRGAAQLGLPLLLAARRHADAARFDEWRLLRRSADVARLAVARRRRQSESDSNHVRHWRRAAADRMGRAVAAGLRAIDPGADRQRRPWAVATRHLR